MGFASAHELDWGGHVDVADPRLFAHSAAPSVEAGSAPDPKRLRPVRTREVVESGQRGLESGGHRSARLVINPNWGVNGEHSIRALYDWLGEAMARRGPTPVTRAQARARFEMDLGLELTGAKEDDEKQAWRDTWSAGQGVGGIHDLPKAAALVDRLRGECFAASVAQPARSANRAA